MQNVTRGLDAPWTARRKSETIKGIVLAFADSVTSLTNRLQADFSLGESSLSYLQAYADTAMKLEIISAAIIDSQDTYSLLERSKAVKAFVLAQESRVRVHAIGARIHEAMATLQKANAHVASAVQDDSYDLQEIREYGKQIQKISTMQLVLSR